MQIGFYWRPAIEHRQDRGNTFYRRACLEISIRQRKCRLEDVTVVFIARRSDISTNEGTTEAQRVCPRYRAAQDQGRALRRIRLLPQSETLIRMNCAFIVLEPDGLFMRQRMRP